MRRKLMSTLIFSMAIALFMSSTSLAQPQDETIKEEDTIEWVALWGFPQTREEQLERMLTTELQRRTLRALQEKRYLKPGKENVYHFDPFQVTDIREVKGGFYELDILASVHKVRNNKIDKKTDKYQITLRYSYDSGFVVTNVGEK
ncbi:hypothetical protein [Paenibacillus tuaregi]|uniref:hypothetical protein n=1 Tax=Paenibacillus tuaregi TaxID=1816681 RepID=UPI0009EF2C74|nr:hypothetical protein [Paenibacillus tuaregi]